MRTSEHPATSGLQRLRNSISRPKCRLLDLSSQHRELVAQHDDLQLFELSRSEEQSDKL